MAIGVPLLRRRPASSCPQAAGGRLRHAADVLPVAGQQGAGWDGIWGYDSAACRSLVALGFSFNFPHSFSSLLRRSCFREVLISFINNAFNRCIVIEIAGLRSSSDVK